MKNMGNLDDAPVGSIVWHCSDEDSGPDVGVSLKLGDTRMLWCGEITSKTYREAECESYGQEPGWWLILYDGPLTSVIARCFDHAAAIDTLELLSRIILAGEPSPDALTGCADDQTWAGVSASALREAAETARVGETDIAIPKVQQ